MVFSSGILDDCWHLLHLVESGSRVTVESPNTRTFSLASISSVMGVIEECGWGIFDNDGIMRITSDGYQILNAPKRDDQIRLQLEHMMHHYNPSWCAILPRGRSESARLLPPDVAQCFKDGGVFDSLSEDVIAWWDKMTKHSLNQRQDDYFDIGRKG